MEYEHLRLDLLEMGLVVFQLGDEPDSNVDEPYFSGKSTKV